MRKKQRKMRQELTERLQKQKMMKATVSRTEKVIKRRSHGGKGARNMTGIKPITRLNRRK